MRSRFTTPLLAILIFLLNVWLNGPLFMTGELPFRGSIEGGYVGMARFISAHPNPWGWNPLVYCGLPVQFMYVPNVLYLAAASMHLFPHVPPDTVFRTIVSLATCLGPVTLFFFSLYFTGSRRWSFILALAYSFLSPSYALFPAVEKDHGIVQLPWRVKVMAKYGEGPHNTGLTLLPLALLAIWKAAKSRTYPPLLGAALLLAAIPLTNWVAAMGLAISSLLMLLAAWTEPDFRFRRAFAAAAMAYLLACFWLTPTFVKTILFNWPVDSYAYKVREQQTWSLIGMIAGVLLLRAVFRFLGGSFYFRFVALGAFVFGWITTAYYVFAVDTIPESHRYAIEFELFMALALIEAFRLTLRNPNSTVRLCAIGTASVMLLVGAPQLWAYVTEGWGRWKPLPPESTVEYQIASWMAGHPPQGRVFASGGLRYRLNSWFDLPQVGGGFETGLVNRIPVDIAFHIRFGNGPWKGHEVEETMLELKAVGTQYVVVHGPKSREYYRDFFRTERLSGTLPVAFHIEDDTIYELPARPLAHLLKPEELVRSNVLNHPDTLAPYVAAIEDASRPQLSMQWMDSATFSVAGPIPPANVVSVQVSADPGWHATQDGREIPVGQDNLGFMVLRPNPSTAAHIELHYRGTTEQRVMLGISALAWLGCAAGLLASRRTSARRRMTAAYVQ